MKLTNLNKNELNKLSKKIKAKTTKGLTKDLINMFSILNGAKYLTLVFISAKKYVKYFGRTTWIVSWKSNGMSE